MVQGSGVGPFSYLVAASDLSPSASHFRMFKYADDSELVTAGKNYDKILDEITHVSNWANKNNLKLNHAKTREIVFF